VEEADAPTEEARIMMYGGWGGWGWIMLMPLLWIALIGVIVWAVVRLTQRPPDQAAQPRRETPRETPREILDRRFASGEIDADAYTRARDTLAGKDARPS
jgi:putative membrane protein